MSQSYKDSVDLIQFSEIEGQLNESSLRPEADEPPAQKTPELAYETALKSLQDQLEVSMENRTNLVTISIETEKPRLSADIVNGIARELDVFIRTKRTTNAPEQRKWIEGRLKEVKIDLEKSENALKDFRENNESSTTLRSTTRLVEVDRPVGSR